MPCKKDEPMNPEHRMPAGTGFALASLFGLAFWTAILLAWWLA